jgi:hypothetical protein
MHEALGQLDGYAAGTVVPFPLGMVIDPLLLNVCECNNTAEAARKRKPNPANCRIALTAFIVPPTIGSVIPDPVTLPECAKNQ